MLTTINSSRRSEQGFALLTVIFMTWLLFTLSLSYFQLIVNEKKNISLANNTFFVDAICEGAIEEALWELNYGGADFDTGSGWVISGLDASKTVSSFTNTSGNAVGSYTITVQNYASINPVINVSATLDGATVHNQASMKAALAARPIFSRALETSSTVTLSDFAYINSYDSSAGAYGGPNVLENAMVFCGDASASAITLLDSTMIYGNVSIPAGASVSDAAKVDGYINNDNLSNIDTVSTPTSLTALSSSGNINSSTTLTAGSYKYNKIQLGSGDTLTINGNVQLYLTGETTSIDISNNAAVNLDSGATLKIYSDGDIQMTGNASINSQAVQSPAKVEIYGASTASISVEDNAVLTACVKAPSAAVQIVENAVMFGSLVANTVTLTDNAALHFDESLIASGAKSGLKLLWFRKN